ncbi:G-type lectin S-receptor-like serine/threonine-protein kinase At5g35370 isoform X2 [Tripterygium wilfordii]|uniref:G-type lectin S-receptor-like serine/threonine-protein kinase At5g35370 isoform X2 n=1 Tax=Tripterygium wilfordii TaxID=458696 RepID=UPI0018F816AF|nr:G-type lectin S-receptor-like serine/threonine-protein kinase At5g35370 isoform X2 [Tripterygium wilfordii]
MWPLYNQFVYPDFTASNFQFIDYSGTFLLSPNASFKASISNPNPHVKQYYFAVVHDPSNTIIWTANRDQPISDSDKLYLTSDGLSIHDEANNRTIWSASQFRTKVSVLELQESGNLVLLDSNNVSVWESFDHPTDALVMGQKLLVGKSLDGSVSGSDLARSDYRLIVTDNDVILQWKGMTYWKLSMDTKALMMSYSVVSFLVMNETGLYLVGSDGFTVVLMVSMAKPDQSGFRIAKLGSDARFSISTHVNQKWGQEFSGPVDDCQIPFFCGRIGLCTTGTCSCPPGFHTNFQCEPTDSSLSLPPSCNATRGKVDSVFSYLKLGDDMDYFANNFVDPTRHGVNLSTCEGLCSQNCSCLGFFHGSSSGSCYLLQSHMGSIMSSSTNKDDRAGYIKTIVVSSPSEDRKFPIAALVLLPSSGVFLFTIIIIGFLWCRRNRLSGSSIFKLGRNDSASSELEIISIPGLPVRFNSEELAMATENFNTKIGSGGFGVVYKGILSDKTVVAVKKITSLGVQGKKEFLSEIAVIGNIHHVNLVRLKGFCAQGNQRFLVYEYMNKGSLDRTLFCDETVLEWQERFEIALGTARGLAYLHSECEHKIIHCDVKPENILLDDKLQAKISDFGLSKLLTPEQSSLFTTMRGTRGYLAPEWLTSSTISDKIDVYSYGMVLLEIVRGRKNCSAQTHSRSTENGGSGTSSSSPGPESRPEYFPLLALQMHEQRRYLQLADPRLAGLVTSEEVEKLVRIALCCVHEEPMLRPTMANVVGMLEGVAPLGVPQINSLNFLRFYGRRFTEASTMEGEHNEILLHPQPRSSSSGSYNSLSYISSQQVSGPR